MKKLLLGALAALMLTMTASAKDNFEVATSIYVGWLPWMYAQDSGLLAKNAKEAGITVNVTKINDYIESINLYTAGEYDACTMTNMDVLAIPGVGGIKSEALIVGDYSNGNDAIVSKTAKSVKDLKGQDVQLVEYSVSHYLLARMLDKNGMKEKDLSVTNTSDSDIATVYIGTKSVKHVVTWNPVLGQVMNDPNSKILADSSEIPFEILDLMVVKENSDPRFKAVLRKTWAQILDMVTNKSNPKHMDMISYMAKSSGATNKEMMVQVKATHFFDEKEEAKFRSSEKLTQVMETVRNFLFDHGLYGDIDDVNAIGIKTTKVLGNKNFIVLKF